MYLSSWRISRDSGKWLPVSEQVDRLIVRQFFGAMAPSGPDQLEIENTDESVRPSPCLPKHVEMALLACGARRMAETVAPLVDIALYSGCSSTKYLCKEASLADRITDSSSGGRSGPRLDSSPSALTLFVINQHVI